MSKEASGSPLATTNKGRRVSTRRRSSPRQGASIYDVAARADVSIVTVSRVFNDYPHVSATMRERVLSAARHVGYKPRLVSKRNTLAMLVGQLDDVAAGEQTSRLVLALIRAAARRNYLIEFIPACSIERATQHLADGLIALGLSARELSSLHGLPKVPRVALNNREVDDSWSVVSLDPYEESQMAVRHLVERGHQRLALVHNSANTWYEQQREEGFSAALAAAGLDGHHVVRCSYHQPISELAQKIKETNCSGCICFCHHGGLPVFDGLQNELGLRVPDDMSLITLENNRVSAHLKPRMTTIFQPLEQLAEATVEGLLTSSKPRAQRFVTVLKGQLISRDSVRRLN